MFAELLGKEAGYCKGKGGSMHIADPDTGISARTPSSAAAPASRRARAFREALEDESGAVCFFGDGAMGQGLLYEVMNMARFGSFP
jgi:pyruvate dehydrogenase E1 component alpha subunit